MSSQADTLCQPPPPKTSPPRMGIVYLTVESSSVKNLIGSATGVSASDLYVDPAAVSVSIINALNNVVCKKLCQAAAFDDQGTTIKVLTSALFLSRTFNIAIQLLAFSQLVAPLLFLQTAEGGSVMSYLGIPGDTIRKTAKAFEPSSGFSCRANQMGNQFFALLVTDFVMSKLLGVMLPLAKLAVAKARGKPFSRAAFRVENKIVALCFFQQLSLVAPVFFPASSIFALIFLTINFKFDKIALLWCGKKPKKAWAARDASGFYLRFYALSLALVSVCLHLTLSLRTLPKQCAWQQASLPAADEGQITFTVPAGSVVKPGTFSTPADCNASGAVVFQANFSAAVYCACSAACGPWIQSLSGYAPLLEFLASDTFPTTVYNIFSSVHLWMLLSLVLAVSRWQIKNTIKVQSDVSAEALTTANQVRTSLVREIRGLKKKLALEKRMGRSPVAVQ